MAIAPDHRDARFVAVYYRYQSIGVAHRIDARNVDVVLDRTTGRVRDGIGMLLEDSLELLGRAVGWRCRSGLARHFVSKPRWESVVDQVSKFAEKTWSRPHEVRPDGWSHDNATLRDGHLLARRPSELRGVGKDTLSGGLQTKARSHAAPQYSGFMHVDFNRTTAITRWLR
jgi:hypothetical protein